MRIVCRNRASRRKPGQEAKETETKEGEEEGKYRTIRKDKAINDTSQPKKNQKDNNRPHSGPAKTPSSTVAQEEENLQQRTSLTSPPPPHPPSSPPEGPPGSPASSTTPRPPRAPRPFSAIPSPSPAHASASAARSRARLQPVHPRAARAPHRSPCAAYAQPARTEPAREGWGAEVRRRRCSARAGTHRGRAGARAGLRTAQHPRRARRAGRR